MIGYSLSVDFVLRFRAHFLSDIKPYLPRVKDLQLEVQRLSRRLRSSGESTGSRSRDSKFNLHLVFVKQTSEFPPNPW